jgi:hypothetical protein
MQQLHLQPKKSIKASSAATSGQATPKHVKHVNFEIAAANEQK